MTLDGRHARLEPLALAHAPALFAANRVNDAIWRYLPYGPFPDEGAYSDWVAYVAGRPDPRFFAIMDHRRDGVRGVASLMRADPANGVVEAGHICLSPELQRTAAASEAIFLLAHWAFEAGYRRFEWKCDACNAPSRRAAMRYGFAYEGVFRQHMIVKGRNRDTAWFAMVDRDWPEIRAAHLAWLAAENFDASGLQRTSLMDLTAPARARAEAEHRRA